MRRGKKGDGHINTEGWMMSYADMATILLAMFIVLSTLGKDQTGVSFNTGTGSFINALHSFGLPGLFSNSPRPVAFSGPIPHYIYTPPPEKTDRGRRDDPKPGRVIDGEQEHLQRFLQEMQRQFPCTRLPRQDGQVIIDIYEPLHKQAPYLADRHNAVLFQVKPLLDSPNYRLQLVVWAPTPAPTAWARAARLADLAAEEFAAAADLDAAARARLVPLGQTWRYRDIRRPAVSVVVIKQQ